MKKRWLGIRKDGPGVFRAVVKQPGNRTKHSLVNVCCNGYRCSVLFPGEMIQIIFIDTSLVMLDDVWLPAVFNIAGNAFVHFKVIDYINLGR